jgi:hypothetical protein
MACSLRGFHAPQMSHLSRGKAASGFSENDIGMDASDCKEINVCDIKQSGAKIGKSPKKRPIFLL